ncbi:MAG TPA: ankyrin repeat domain-containing protein [Phycisphaerales bacterium]|nr:ankyrin repeat domain-containing protein [Phycisphaerales bacterium]
MFLDAGLDPSQPAPGELKTPLHYAALYERPEVAELLLEHGANPEALDYWGNTPLMYAASPARGTGAVISRALVGREPARSER